MASLNLSINGPSIKSSYQGVVNGQLPSSSSPTFAQWALFSVQAPLLNAFQDSGAKESILKVESKGDGELSELLEDFNEGRIQFAFVKVKDTNSGLPKNVLIAWCGGGVPERTKGYFTSHLAAVSKVLHGYHVQITARSDADLSPESIIQKVADASGAKYTAGGSAPSPAPAGGPPPVAKKPVFTPKTSSGAGSFNPLVEARRRKDEEVDADGWGADAPPVNRTEIQKVESAYKPTKVNMAELVKQKQEPSRFNGGSAAQDDRPEVVRGAYQPVGKVDIAAIRAAAKEKQDDRPTVVKGAYEPVGKVDIAAIRAKAQKPAAAADESEDRPKTLSERSSAFSAPQSERLASLPKPKVANKFAGASSFTGTKAPVPGAFGLASPSVSVPAPPPVGAASRTFADQGGKTPAQLWAEKKGKQGLTPTSTGAPAPGPASPVAAQKSGGGGWQSGYQGKSWGTVQTTNFGRGGAAVVEQRTGGDDQEQEHEQEKPASPAGVSSIRDRVKEAPPMGSAAPSAPKAPGGGDRSVDEPTPPPPNMSNRPAAPAGGFALPGLPQRPPEPEEEEEEEPERSPSPPRVAMPVPRGPEPEIEPPAPEPTIPTREIERALPKEEELEEAHDTQARAAATAVAEQQFGQAQVAAGQPSTGGGKRALIQYDYEAAEDNEIELVDGQYVTDIEMVDEDWWMGTNSRGERGLFPSNYVELVEDDDAGAAAPPPPAPAPAPAQAPAAAPAPAAPAAQSQAAKGPTATALYDYEAAEDNELSFPEGAKVMNLEFPDEDWWFGHYQGKSGLFPANYVELDQ
ncbi:uncharacterized protein PgNI_09885 [Pyricularia grisea]|uniref:Actin binding protein n=1 Tax=Pyricularia grisea TaxID=148305 RepID=A0A6P8ARK0_PYRGI|nr:uncharacterized protein PgNI_09885 [Pyricularia grisea]TLD04759.1 hypothetical protein PgNI_09885 [Pyricularia grisea]